MNRYTFTVCVEVQAETQEAAALFAKGLFGKDPASPAPEGVAGYVIYPANECQGDSAIAKQSRGGRDAAAEDQFVPVTPKPAHVDPPQRGPGRPRRVVDDPNE